MLFQFSGLHGHVQLPESHARTGTMLNTMKASLLLFLGAHAVAASTASYRRSDNGKHLVVFEGTHKTANTDWQTRNPGLGCRRPAGPESRLAVDSGRESPDDHWQQLRRLLHWQHRGHPSPELHRSLYARRAQCRQPGRSGQRLPVGDHSCCHLGPGADIPSRICTGRGVQG